MQREQRAALGQRARLEQEIEDDGERSGQAGDKNGDDWEPCVLKPVRMAADP